MDVEEKEHVHLYTANRVSGLLEALSNTTRWSRRSRAEGSTLGLGVCRVGSRGFPDLNKVTIDLLDFRH